MSIEARTRGALGVKRLKGKDGGTKDASRGGKGPENYGRQRHTDHPKGSVHIKEVEPTERREKGTENSVRIATGNEGGETRGER